MDANQKADALEHAMGQELEKVIMKPAIATTYRKSYQNKRREEGQVYHMGHDDRLPKMSEKPTLLEYFDKRIGHSSHLLQSARLAKINGLPEKIVLACLLHDISNGAFIKTDHGYYGSQLVAPSRGLYPVFW